MSLPTVNSSLPTSKGSSIELCTFLSYGKSETVSHKVEERDGEKFVNMNFNLMRENDGNQIS